MVIGGGRKRVDDELMQSGRALRFIPVASFPLLKDYVSRGVITTTTCAVHQFGIGSARGEEGVTKALEIIHKELDITMAFCGHTNINTVDKSILLPGTY